MAYVLIAHAIGFQNAGPIDTSGADLIVICCDINSSPYAPTDSNGNSMAAGFGYYGGGGGQSSMYPIFSPIVGPGHTFQIGNPTSSTSIAVSAWSGSAASPLDVETGSDPSGVTGPFNAGAVSPSVDGCLIITGLVLGSNAGRDLLTLSSPFTLLDGLRGQEGSYYGQAHGYEIQTTAAARNPVWEWSPVSAGMGASVAVFKPGLVYSKQVVPMRRMLSYFEAY